MTQIGISDLSRGYFLRSQNRTLDSALTRLSNEVVTGQSSDTVARLNGHFSYLTHIETDLARGEARSIAVQEAGITASAIQLALGRISDTTDDLVSTYAVTAFGSDPTGLDATIRKAKGTLDIIVSALNSEVAGRQLFSGADVDQVPLPTAETLLDGLRTAISGEISIGDVTAAAEDFFNQPGGIFESTIYAGSETDLVPVDLGAGETVQIDLRADNSAFRDLMKSVALAALADDPALSLPEGARRTLVDQQLGSIMTARDQVIIQRADVGFAEERIDRAQARIGAERSGLLMARNDVLSIDPYEAASEMESVRQQLEILYSVTARTSRLSLANFL